MNEKEESDGEQKASKRTTRREEISRRRRRGRERVGVVGESWHSDIETASPLLIVSFVYLLPNSLSPVEAVGHEGVGSVE